MIIDLFPHIPLISKIGSAVLDFFQRILPTFALKVIRSIYSFVAAIATKISSICTNLIAICFGSNKGSAPNPQVEKEGLDNREGMKYFDRLIEEPGDLLRDDPAIIYSPAKFVHWQLDQGSTFIYPYDGSPQLAIVPTETH